MLVGVPAELLLRQPDLLLAQRRAVGLGGVLHVRAAVGDVRAELDHRGPPHLALGLDQGPLEPFHVVAVAVDLLDVPAVGLETLGPVLGEGQLRRAVDADVVVVVDDHEIVQAQVTGQRAGLGGDALLQVAVAGEDVDLVVDDREALAVEVVGQVLLGDGHAHGIRDPLPQRAGGRLDAELGIVLGMSRRLALPLPEPAECPPASDVVAGQIEQGVEQHAAVPAREDEPVAVVPGGMGRIELQVPRPQDVGRRGHAHRHARMAALGLLDRIQREKTDRIDAQLIELRQTWMAHHYFPVKTLTLIFREKTRVTEYQPPPPLASPFATGPLSVSILCICLSVGLFLQ